MTRFIPNPTFKQEMVGDPEFRRGMAQITARVAESIQAAAAPFRDTGAYMREIGPVPETVAGQHRVALPRHIWHIVELGSVNNPPQANVRRGVRAAGLRFEDDRAALT